MRAAKEAVKALLRGAVAHRPIFRSACGDSLCVFLYHEVTDDPSPFDARYQLNVPTALFRKQLHWIRELFHVISPRELLSGQYPRPAALITFDDGAPGYFENALPALKEAGCPSLIFLNMEPIQGGSFWAALITYLCEFEDGFLRELEARHGGRIPGPPELFCERAFVEDYLSHTDRERILAAARRYHGSFATERHLAAANDGLAFFGNHLFNHYNAALLSDSELLQAFERNAAELAKYPNSTPLFSYPFGDPRFCYTDRTNRLLYDAGAKVIFSARPMPNFDPAARLLHRIALNDQVRSEQDLLFRVLFPVLRARLRS